MVGLSGALVLSNECQVRDQRLTAYPFLSSPLLRKQAQTLLPEFMQLRQALSVLQPRNCLLSKVGAIHTSKLQACNFTKAKLLCDLCDGSVDVVDV